MGKTVVAVLVSVAAGMAATWALKKFAPTVHTAIY